MSQESNQVTKHLDKFPKLRTALSGNELSFLEFSRVRQKSFIFSRFNYFSIEDRVSRVGASASELGYRRSGLEHQRSEKQKSEIEDLGFSIEDRDIEVIEVIE